MGIIDIHIPEFGILPQVNFFLRTDWLISKRLGIPIENFVLSIHEIRRQEERKMQILMSLGINLHNTG